MASSIDELVDEKTAAGDSSSAPQTSSSVTSYQNDQALLNEGEVKKRSAPTEQSPAPVHAPATSTKDPSVALIMPDEGQPHPFVGVFYTYDCMSDSPAADGQSYEPLPPGLEPNPRSAGSGPVVLCIGMHATDPRRVHCLPVLSHIPSAGSSFSSSSSSLPRSSGDPGAETVHIAIEPFGLGPRVRLANAWDASPEARAMRVGDTAAGARLRCVVAPRVYELSLRMLNTLDFGSDADPYRVRPRSLAQLRRLCRYGPGRTPDAASVMHEPVLDAEARGNQCPIHGRDRGRGRGRGGHGGPEEKGREKENRNVFGARKRGKVGLDRRRKNYGGKTLRQLLGSG